MVRGWELRGLGKCQGGAGGWAMTEGDFQVTDSESWEEQGRPVQTEKG